MNVMKAYHIGAIAIFLVCMVIGSLTDDAVIAVAIVCAGVFIAGLIFLYPVIEGISERKSSGEIKFSPYIDCECLLHAF